MAKEVAVAKRRQGRETTGQPRRGSDGQGAGQTEPRDRQQAEAAGA